MRASALLMALLAVQFVSTSASAQLHMGPRNQRMDPVSPDTALQLDPRQNECASGDTDACFAIEFGRCADANPRRAIPACTRQLVEQDNRRTGGNTRYERAIRYTLRANAYLKRGDADRALADYDRAITADKTVFWIHAQRGDAYFLTGDFEEALVSYNAALALSAGNASVLSNRALIFAAAPNEGLRNASQALTDAQRANTLAPGQPAYIDTLAVAYAANGDFTRAAAEVERAINLLPPGDEDVLSDYQLRLGLYRGGMPFRMAPSPGA